MQVLVQRFILIRERIEFEMSDFKDLVAIVTGGASGIGEATAKLIQSRGGKVFVFDRNQPKNPIIDAKPRSGVDLFMAIALINSAQEQR